METIYIDRLFVLNLIIDYFILTGSAKVCGGKLRRERYAVSALFGALFAALSVLPEMGYLSLAPVKLACGVLMALIAFGKEDKLLRCTVVFFAVSALFAGAVSAVSLKGGYGHRGIIYTPLSMPVLILSFGIIYALLSIVFRCTAKNAGKKISDVSIEHKGKSISLRALCDTGNTLLDPISGDSVLIASSDVLCKLIPDCEKVSAETLYEFPDYKFRLIPYRAVGTADGLLPAFRPETLSIDGKVRDDILVAFSPQIGGDGFNAIL